MTDIACSHPHAVGVNRRRGSAGITHVVSVGMPGRTSYLLGQVKAMRRARLVRNITLLAKRDSLLQLR